MLKFLTLAVVICLASAGSALAACPPAIPGSTAEAIRANEQRVICLQQEVQDNSRYRQLESDVRRNENAINRIQLERRFDALPRPIPTPFVRPAPFGLN
jgi:hypothetical protein